MVVVIGVLSVLLANEIKVRTIAMVKSLFTSSWALSSSAFNRTGLFTFGTVLFILFTGVTGKIFTLLTEELFKSLNLYGILAVLFAFGRAGNELSIIFVFVILAYDILCLFLLFFSF